MFLQSHTAQSTSLSQIIEQIRSARQILILTHYRPDGDAIGSSLALASSLRATGKKIWCLNQDSTPEYLRFLESSELAMQAELPPDQPLDLIIALDCATIERLGKKLVQSLPTAPVVVIDHHVTNEQYGDLLFLDTEASATGEILYDLITGGELPLPPQARDALYVAISTDTGSLQYSNTTAKTYRIMSELVALGVDVSTLNAMVYHNHSVRRIHLLKSCLEGFTLAQEGEIAYWTLSWEAQNQIKAQPGDLEGLMDILRSIQGVRVCFTLEVTSNEKIRLSMRSKDSAIDVSEICGSFGGGGHRMAAGAAMLQPLAKCVEQVLATTSKALYASDKSDHDSKL